jgi:hypothetical protein
MPSSSYGTIVLLCLLLPPATQALQLSKPATGAVAAAAPSSSTQMLLLLRRGRRRCSPPRLMSAGAEGRDGEEDTASEAARLRKVADTAGIESLTAASSEAAAALEKLQSGFEKRLEAMGAAETVPPPPAPPSRSAFGISNASANTKAAEEALYRMRMKDNGLLEAENAESIRKAQRAAKQWLDAGLSERAKSELERVQPFCSYKTEVGAEFHLLLAKIQGLCGQTAQARRTLQRVASDAETSTQRWQAERQLESSAASGGMKLPPPTEASQYSDLFQMPEWD